jgi:hypothetical protein
VPIVTPDLAAIWRRIQVCLLPGLEKCLDEPLTERLKQFVRVLEVVRIEEHVAAPPELPQGRPRRDRRLLARAFLAKAVYNLTTTELLMEMLRLQPNLRRLCDWERRRQIPSPATFSRAFAEFAAAGLGDAVHAALVQKHVSTHVVMHVSCDATEIAARQKSTPKAKAQPAPLKKRGRPKKGEVREQAPTRLQRQLSQTVEQALCELPRLCEKGTKTDSKGHWHFWVGWNSRACTGRESAHRLD